MNYYGKDYSYARERLSQTLVCLNDGTPAYIKNVMEDGKVYYSLLTDLDGEKEGKLSDIDLTPIKLGWVNTNRGIAYTTRVPARKWKQGLSMDIFYIVYRGDKVNLAFPSSYLIDTVKNNYPSYKSIKETITPTTKKAFSRNWAVDAQALMYNGRVVGVMDQYTTALNKRDAYLREFFQETTGDDCAYC